MMHSLVPPTWVHKSYHTIAVTLVLLLLPLVALGQDFIRTGTYIGDGAVSREISGLGFQPDVVMVKAETDRWSIIRITGMPDGKSKKLADNKSLEPDRIEGFLTDGFVVGNHDDINKEGVRYYWVAMREVSGKLDVGYYVGDGNNLRTVNVDNMLPQASVIIPAGNDLCVFHSMEMDFYETYAFDGSGLVDNSIAWNDVNSIKVGTSHSVNEIDKDYYFIAWKSTSNEIESGAYLGNGLNGRTISAPGFDPHYTLIFNDNDALPVHRPKPLSGDATLFFDQSAVTGNLIESMTDGDFILGDDPSVNENNAQYYWFALANSVNPADLHLQVSVDDANPDEDQNLNLIIELTNLGPNDATGVQITNLLPTGLTFVSASPDQGTYEEATGIWDLGSIINGQNRNLNLVASVDAGSGGMTLTHTASITSFNETDPDPGNNTASQEITVAAPAGADLQVAWDVDETNPAEGDALTYTLTVTNNGPAEASGIELTTALPAQMTITGNLPGSGSYDQASQIWILGTLDVDQTETLQIQATVNPGSAGQTLASSASLTALDQEDLNADNNSASVEIQVVSIDLQVTMSASTATPAEGAGMTFTIVTANLGETPLTGIVITDLLPAGLTFQTSRPSQGVYNPANGEWALGDLGIAGTQALTIEAVVDGLEGSNLTNSASVTAVDQNDSNPANDTASVSVLVGPAGGTDLALNLTLDDPSPQVGQVITYTVTVDNLGPSGATGIEVIDMLPSEISFVTALTNKGTYDEGSGLWDIDTLAVGFQAGLTIQAQVLPAAVGAPITSTANITALDQADPDGGNDTDSVSFNVPVSDLQISMTRDPAIASVGDTVNFTLTVLNEGPSLATGIVVEDLLPDGLAYVSASGSQGSYDQPTGLWSIGSLNPALDASLILSATVSLPSAGSNVFNTARVVAADQADTVPGNNSFTTSVNVPGADLAVTLTPSTLVASEGDEVQYTLTLGNSGPDQSTGIQVAFPLPDEVTFQNSSPSQGTFDEGTGLWDIGTLPSGTSVFCVVTTEVNPGTAGSVIVGATSITSSDQADPVSGNNTATASVTVPAEIVGEDPLVWPVVGTPTTAQPGTSTYHSVLTFAIVNRGANPDTLHALVVSNLTPGTGTPVQKDDEWQPLEASFKATGHDHSAFQTTPIQAFFQNGQADFSRIDRVIAPGDTLAVTISGAPSLAARDGVPFKVGITGASDLELEGDFSLIGNWPLVSGQVLNVDGFVADQAAIVPYPSGLLSIGSQQNLALTVDLPGNGYLPDTLQGLSLKNSGTALPGTDITAVEIWVNETGADFNPAVDTSLGLASFSGDRWSLTGLNVSIPAEGRRFFATVDIAETANPLHDIRLALPVGNGQAVEMESGNDGPVDQSLENPNTLGINVSNRIILHSEWFPAGTALPGADDLTLLKFVLTNTYPDARSLQALTFTNTAMAPGATDDERDALCQQVDLRLDGNNNGVVDDLNTDPRLGSGSFFEGRVTFGGLSVDLEPGDGTRVFVTADLGLTTCADGNRLTGAIASLADIDIHEATVVSPWPLASAAEWTVNGMTAEQITTRNISVLTLGPGEGPVLALDLTVPANGYAVDELNGLTLVNTGTADNTSLASAQLWEDGGNGSFDAGSIDDIPLGLMSISDDTWSSTVLSRLIPTTGLQLFASVTVNESPEDSVTVNLGLPTGAVTVASGNDGPVDMALEGDGMLVISTSPLRSSVDFTSLATNTGQSGTLSMRVTNAGSEPVSNVTPELGFLDGQGLLTLGGSTPAQVDLLAAGMDTVFTWDYDSVLPGLAVLEGNASGFVNIDQVRRSIATPTSGHRIHTPVPQLDLYPTASLPFSINRGQVGLVPLSLTFFNPGGPDVANAHLTSLRLSLKEGPEGPGIVPSTLLNRVVASEGTNIYLVKSDLEDSGQTIDLVFPSPVVITGSEPVTLGLRLDLQADSTVPSFMVSLEEASYISGQDAINGADVPVLLGEGDFPVSTGQATLVSPASGLLVAVAEVPGSATVPGQTDIPLIEVLLSQTIGSDNSSTIDVGRIAFLLRDQQGQPLADPDQWFTRLSLRSSFQEHYSGFPTLESDSLLVMPFLSPVTISGDAVIPLRLYADMAEDSPLGSVLPVVGAAGYFDARDGNINNPVPVNLTTAPEGAALRVLGPASTLMIAGEGALPGQVSQGTRDLAALLFTLENGGASGTAAIQCDTLNLSFLDAARQPLDLSLYLDRVKVSRGELVLGQQIDPADPSGTVQIPLSGVSLEPGAVDSLEIQLDLKPECPHEALEMILGSQALIARDAITAAPVAVQADGPTGFPLSSGLAVIVAPSDELIVHAESQMPPLLVPRQDSYPVMTVHLTNPAGTGSGGIQINSLTLQQDPGKADNPALGQVVSEAYLMLENQTLANLSELNETATALTLVPTDPLVIPAGVTLSLDIAILLASTAPPGSLILSLQPEGIAAGPPGGDGMSVQILPLSGTAFPFVTEPGNTGGATLTASYANFPNPFAAGRESTTFAFSLQKDARVSLRLLTPHGELVASILKNATRPAGFYQSDQWTGHNGNGTAVHNGVYLAELVAEYSDGTRERVLRKVAVVR